MTTFSRFACLAFWTFGAVACSSESVPPEVPSKVQTQQVASVPGTSARVPGAEAAGDAGAPAGWLGVLLPGREVELDARTGGRLIRLEAGLGDRVVAGQSLFRVEARVAEARLEQARAGLEQAEAALLSARAALATAEDRRERRLRLEELFAGEERVAAENEARVAQAAVAAAEAAARAASAAVAGAREELAAAEVRAPFAGRVVLLHRDAGASLAAGEPVLRLALEGEILLRFAVPPTEASRLAAGERVLFRLAGSDVSELHTAEVRQIAPGIDAPSGLVFVEAATGETLPWGSEVEVFKSLLVREAKIRTWDRRAPARLFAAKRKSRAGSRRSQVRILASKGPAS